MFPVSALISFDLWQQLQVKDRGREKRARCQRVLGFSVCSKE